MQNAIGALQTNTAASRKVAGWRTWIAQPEVWLFILLLASYAYFFPRWAHWGQNSKLDLTMAIVDQGTFSIDDYYHNTGDYALYKGKHYSDKAPGISFLGVPFYAIFKLIAQTSTVDQVITRLSINPAMTSTLREGGTGLLKEKVYFAMAMSSVTFFAVSVPSALLGAILYRFLGRLTTNSSHRILVVVVYGLATIAFPQSQGFSGRQLVATLTFSCFFLLFRLKRGELSPHWLWLVGLFMGWSAITDYPTGLILVGLFVYAFFAVRQKRHLLALIGGGIPPVLLAMYYNYSCFDTPMPVGYFYSELYTDLHYTGLLSLTYPKPDAIWGLTFSPFRGLLYLSPFLLLAVPGFWSMARQQSYRAEWALCVWAVISFFTFNSSSAMWWAGFSVGPAYLNPMLPYLVVPIVFFLRDYVRRLWHWALVGLLTIWSFLFVWIETIGGQSPPDLTPNPLWTLSMPAALRGDIARNWGMLLHLRGLVSLLPLMLLAALAVYFLIRRPQSAQEVTMGA
jgi:hypothetical protein